MLHIDILSMTRGQCYDHNFRRFLPMYFLRKNGIFLKNSCNDPNFTKMSSILNKNTIFRRIFGENIFKIITSVPGSPLGSHWSGWAWREVWLRNLQECWPFRVRAENNIATISIHIGTAFLLSEAQPKNALVTPAPPQKWKYCYLSLASVSNTAIQSLLWVNYIYAEHSLLCGVHSLCSLYVQLSCFAQPQSKWSLLFT
jgi:hypothetical protein